MYTFFGVGLHCMFQATCWHRTAALSVLLTFIFLYICVHFHCWHLSRWKNYFLFFSSQKTKRCLLCRIAWMSWTLGLLLPLPPLCDLRRHTWNFNPLIYNWSPRRRQRRWHHGPAVEGSQSAADFLLICASLPPPSGATLAASGCKLAEVTPGNAFFF